MFKPITMTLPTAKQLRRPQVDDHQGIVNDVFKVLHGWHGNFFLAKFATGQLAGAGEVDATGQSIEGQDWGVLNARNIWAHELRTYDASTVKTALAQCIDRYRDSPPNLPQLVAICAAIKPRQVYKPELPAIGMGQALRSKYAAQAREINIRHAQKAMHFSPTVFGLDGLKQAIANAVASAGGDEVSELVRLDFLLAPKRALKAA